MISLPVSAATVLVFPTNPETTVAPGACVVRDIDTLVETCPNKVASDVSCTAENASHREE
jgi:hypothetical protein